MNKKLSPIREEILLPLVARQISQVFLTPITNAEMNIESIKDKLNEYSIFHVEEKVLNRKSIIGYEKMFKWRWGASQLHTFIIATDYGSEEVNISLFENHLSESFKFAEQNYKGWPRGIGSGIAVISILISSNVSAEAKDFCRKLESEKRFAGFLIPVAYNSETNEVFQFERKPFWGGMYHPYLKKLINSLK